MTAAASSPVVIVDCALGNLFSIENALARVGLPAVITHDPARLEDAPAAILPGVGAFGDAMATLRRNGLDSALRDFAASGRPLVGICLGMQLLFRESREFGIHAGLDLIRGDVVRFPEPPAADRPDGPPRQKIPFIGWQQIDGPSDDRTGKSFRGPLLDGINPGTFMYFLHSYYVRPEDPEVVAATTLFGDLAYCSAVRQDNVHGFQFHPERSGDLGLTIFRNLAALIGAAPQTNQNVD